MECNHILVRFGELTTKGKIVNCLFVNYVKIQKKS